MYYVSKSAKKLHIETIFFSLALHFMCLRKHVIKSYLFLYRFLIAEN